MRTHTFCVVLCIYRSGSSTRAKPHHTALCVVAVQHLIHHVKACHATTTRARHGMPCIITHRVAQKIEDSMMESEAAVQGLQAVVQATAHRPMSLMGCPCTAAGGDVCLPGQALLPIVCSTSHAQGLPAFQARWLCRTIWSGEAGGMSSVASDFICNSMCMLPNSHSHTSGSMLSVVACKMVPKVPVQVTTTKS